MAVVAPRADPAAERLFFALWPPAPVRSRLAAAGAGLIRVCGGRPVPAASLHLTLHFLGAVPAAERASVERAADAVIADCLALRLDHLGFWPGSGIGWAGPSAAPAGLLALRATLGAALDDCPAALPGRARDRRFVPHVTLLRPERQPKGRARPARDAEGPGRVPADGGRRSWPLAAPIDWPVRAFVLVRSRLEPAGARYEVLQRWPLRAPRR